MSNKIRINISLGTHKHPLWIDAADEPLYREAGRLVNRILEHYSTRYRGAQLPPDYLMAFTAMDMAVRFLRQDADSNAEAAADSMEQTLAGLRDFLNDKSENPESGTATETT